MDNAESQEIPIDDSILEVKDTYITFSVNKVEKKPIENLETAQEAYDEIIKRLSAQYTFEYDCEKSKKRPKVTDRSPPRPKKLLVPGLNESRLSISMRSQSSEAINKSSSFPYGSQKMPDVLAIYKPKPTPNLDKAAFQSTRQPIVKNKFQGLGSFQDSSLKRSPSDAKCIIKTGFPSSISAIHYAYLNHQNLAISPTDFIILIGQGLCRHMNMNPEKLKHQFFDNQRQIVIKSINSKISPNGKSDWLEIFEVLTQGVKRALKVDIYNALVDDFSTGNNLTKIASEMSLLSTVKNYFKHKSKEGCGFPKITLKGTVDDWKKFREKIYLIHNFNAMDQLDLDWWFKYLLRVVDKICEAGVERKVDRKFWANMCQNFQDYAVMITGWINVFLPYTYTQCDGHKRNNALKAMMLDDFSFNFGIEPESITEGVSKVPFFFFDGAGSHPMHCYSGFLGAKYDEKNDWVEPEYFWSIFEDARL